MPVFPGIKLVVSLSFLALELKRWPSEVYDQYLNQPRDIELLVACLEYRKRLEDKEKVKIEEEQEKIHRNQRLRGY